MPKLKNRLPKLTKSENYACVYYNGKRHRLGIWGSKEAKVAYARFIAELQANPLTFETTEKIGRGTALVVEIAADYFKHIQGRMHSAHVSHFRVAIGYLVEIYGDISVDDFTPKKLKVVRERMVQSGTLCRNQINSHIARILRIFSWAVSEELAQPNTVAALREVKSLRKGEDARTFDHPPRQEVPDKVVIATLPFMSLTVAAMVQIQRLTGMRPSEICEMTVGDIDTTRDAELWYYIPKFHKTERFIGEKVVPLGKPEQNLIAPYLSGKQSTDAVFSPKTAMEEHYAERRANRKTKITPSQAARDAAREEKTTQRHGEFYDQSSYRGAVLNAIKKGNKILPEGQKLPHWTPYQIRHAAGTAAEKADGLDEAQALLGHRTANVTRRYAHGQLAIAESMARKRVNPFETGKNESTEQQED